MFNFDRIVDTLVQRSGLSGMSNSELSRATDFCTVLAPCLDDEECARSIFELGSVKLWKAQLKRAKKQLVWTDKYGEIVYQKNQPHIVDNEEEEDHDNDEYPAIAMGDSTPLVKTQNSIMDFEAVVTTNRKDREGDILECEGAELDPMAPLLLQHVPAMNIGKVIKETYRDKTMLRAQSAIAPVPLGYDAATLVEFGALRISHGFLPLEWEELPVKNGERPSFLIRRYKIYEKSLVSIPANEDAIILAWSRDKLTHPIIKSWAFRLKGLIPQMVVSGYNKDDQNARTISDTGVVESKYTSRGSSGESVVSLRSNPEEQRIGKTIEDIPSGSSGRSTPSRTTPRQSSVSGGNSSNDVSAVGHISGSARNAQSYAQSGAKSSSGLPQCNCSSKGAKGQDHGGSVSTNTQGRGGACEHSGGTVVAPVQNGNRDLPLTLNDGGLDVETKKGAKLSKSTKDKLTKAMKFMDEIEGHAELKDAHVCKTLVGATKVLLKGVMDEDMSSANPATEGENPGANSLANPGVGNGVDAEKSAIALLSNLYRGTPIEYPTLMDIQREVAKAIEDLEIKELEGLITIV